MLHLIGDIHQPLHTSGRVTDAEREGDHGGNDFKLGRGRNPPTLHSYWDGIVDRSVRRRRGEAEDEYVERLAADIVRRHPASALEGRLRFGEYEGWAREGLRTAMEEAYPADLRRGVQPSRDYRARVFRVAEPALALGGYRLAETMNRLFR